MLAGHTILRIIGRGGAATVYLARQESLNRQVAIKVLRADVEDPKVWRRFLREARTLARLSTHPHVVTVFNVGRSDDGQPYLVTEFLDRGSLGDVIAARGPLPVGSVVPVGHAVADALQAAHDLGILHRDVKPGNVLLDHDGRVKLGDFGIARLLTGQSVTTTDVIAFTPEHVAPEVLRGEPDGPWSDVYGLASTLAEALIGAPLFTRRPDERVEALLSRKLMGPPPVLPATVPAALAQLLARGLDPDPTRRPSLADFRQQLTEAATEVGAPAPLPPPSPAPAAPPGPAAVPTPAVAGATAFDDESPNAPTGGR
ncbi:MAG: serine/threonine protein kinase, partial [Acidimicrobiia bacterium]|nr:serine/threonine protein kinase [Acidimicrobiia bacterium]